MNKSFGVAIGVLAVLIAGAAGYLVGAHGDHLLYESSTRAEGGEVVARGPDAAEKTAPVKTLPNTPQTKLAAVQLTSERMQSIGVTIGKVERKKISDDIRVTGNVDVNERLLSYVQVRFPGYIQKAFANASYLYVRKGQPLFTIYSPELVATEQEYLLARQDQTRVGHSTVSGVASGALSLTSAAEERLRQWQIPEGELNQLKRTGKIVRNLQINSPVSGYITEYNALPNMYAEPSTRLYTVADLSTVWVYAQVFQDRIGRLRPGDAASITVDSYPGKIFHGRIDRILPQVDPATRTIRVRLAITNPKTLLKPGMFVNVVLKANLGRQLVIPSSAVLHSGMQPIVFIARGQGYFQPRDVVLGQQTGNSYIVLKGLSEHERILTSANFLIDSESQLQSAAGSYMPPPPGAGQGNGTSSNAQTAAHIDFSTDPNPPHKGSNVFRVKATDAHGSPLTGASITVTFHMPAMPAMGMAAMSTTNKLNEQSGGMYQGSGTLGSGGAWQVFITVQKNGVVVASKRLSVSAAGGM